MKFRADSTYMLKDVNPLFLDIEEQQKIADKMFDRTSRCFSPIKIYGIAMKKFPKGSPESLELFRILLRFKPDHSIFKTRVVRKLIEFMCNLFISKLIE